jgi:alanine racemase
MRLTKHKRSSSDQSSLERGPKGFLKRVGEVDSGTDTLAVDRAVAEMNSWALQKNFRAIQEQVPDQEILPMLKANAYGHGVAWAAQQLAHLNGVYGFGLATLNEGAQLRAILGPKGRRIPIVIFSETTPWSDSVGQFCEKHGLTAVIATEKDWTVFIRDAWAKRIPYEIQFNTGMNRLGISLSFSKAIAKSLKNLPTSQHPKGIFSHLAMSESFDNKLTLSQMEKFHILKQELASISPSARFHLANSGGIWNAKGLNLKGLTHLVRPGLSLYGIPPWPGAPERGLRPVMTFKVRVLAVHRLKPGDSIGYGGTYRVTGTDPVFAAILGAGYADGVHRSLSNQGYADLAGKSARFLGIVSMDLCAVECSENTQVGSWAELIGPRVDPWAQAKAAHTIPYELLTSVSSRVKRVYDSEPS